MALTGMDTVRGSDLAAALATAGDDLEALRDRTEELVRTVIATGWTGTDAEAFAARWQGDVLPLVDRGIAAARSRREHVAAQVAEQDTASSVAGGTAGRFDQHLELLGADWTDISWAEFRENLAENIGVDGLDTATGLVDGTHSVVGQLLRTSGAKVVPGFFPVVGDVFTGVVAGVDRWHDDAGRTDLPRGERLGRAIVDGSANLGGSLLLGTALSWSLGMLGLALGGGSGGAAGAAAGGAPAVPGAVGGGTIGAAVGGVTGDVGGSYIGATLADSLIDTALD
jgi:hypothetical protein